MPAWTATCGSSPTSGPATATPTSRRHGSPAATSAGTTNPGKTAGYSATATAAPTCPSSPGPRSSGTRWSGAGHPPMTLPRPATGPNGAAKASHRSTAAPSTCSAGKRPLPAMRRPAPARRSRTTKPATMGTVAPHHPQGDHQAHRHTRAGRPTGRHPSHARTLPPPGNRRTQGTSTSLHLKPPTGLARAVCVDEAHARFLGGRGAAMRPAYPATCTSCYYRGRQGS